MFRRKVETYSVKEFCSGEWKTKKKATRKRTVKTVTRIVSAVAIPALTGGTLLPLSLAFSVPSAFACTKEAVETAGTVSDGVTHFVSKHTIDVIAHSLDPVVEILVAFAFPVASVIMAGACFLFMFNRADKGFEMIQRAGLGYVLVQMLPFLLGILKEIGDAM